MITLPMSADGQAVALACSAIAPAADGSHKPLTAREWHALSLTMRSTELRPRDLLGMAADDLRETLGVAEDLADRLAGLLSRGGQMAMEVERLASRGIWVITRADDAYPLLLKKRLLGQAPPVLFGAGPQAGLTNRAIAVVGSRDVDEDGLEFAAALGQRCAVQGRAVVSGGARGVDEAAMHGALSHGGPAIGVTVDPLERLVRRRELRHAITNEQLTLVTPFHPSARWHQGNAMRRNRLIYVLAEAAVVVASSAEKGGTRAGASENLKARWVPLHVRDDGSAGNRKLIAEGAQPLAALDDLDLTRLMDRPDLSLLDAIPSGIEPHIPSAPESIDADDVFAAAWPILARHLTQPRTEREVADATGLELTQARAWLKRAVDEGRLEVKSRPKRYVLPIAGSEQLRIDEAIRQPRGR